MIDWLTPELIALKRDAIESIYDHRMTVYEVKQVYNPKTGFDEPQEVKKYEDEPCRISTQVTYAIEENPDLLQEKTNLICAPELDIPMGCHIEVKFYNGVVKRYKQISSARAYSDHQTLIMQRYVEGQEKFA